MTLMTPLIIVLILFFLFLFLFFFLDYYLYMSIFTSPEATNCFNISSFNLMIIRENKIVDQFPTPKHQQILLPF